MKRLPLFILLAYATLLGGCAQFKNRLSCTLDGQSSLFNSMYMNVGVTSYITPEDLPAECKKLQEKKPN